MRPWVAPVLAASCLHGAFTALPVMFGDTPAVAKRAPSPVMMRFVAPPPQEAPPPKVIKPRRKMQGLRPPEPKAPEPPPPQTPPAPPPVEEVTTPEPPPPVAAPVAKKPRFDPRAYGRRVHRLVEAERNYPRVAQRLRLEGQALVKIAVGRDGSLAAEPRIHTSSGSKLLDREALRMVRAAAPFEVLPSTFERDQLMFAIPVRFRLEG